MQRFIAKYIGSQVDLRKLILHLEQQKSELNEQVKVMLMKKKRKIFIFKDNYRFNLFQSFKVNTVFMKVEVDDE